jgi:oligopeptide transport system permease protein
MPQTLSIIFLLCFFILSPFLKDFSFINWSNILSAPDNSFFFGTDGNGRDILSRIIYGGRVSILVSIFSVIGSGIIGIIIGSVSGYFQGIIDSILMRVVDVLYSLPFIFCVMVFTSLVGRSPATIVLSISLFGWMDIARMIRGQTMHIKSYEFIQVAKSFKYSNFWIWKYHIMPHLKSSIIVTAITMIPKTIIIESFISFLGLGIQEPYTSLGIMIQDGIPNIEVSWWCIMFPSIALMMIIISFYTISDWIRKKCY